MGLSLFVPTKRPGPHVSGEHVELGGFLSVLALASTLTIARAVFQRIYGPTGGRDCGDVDSRGSKANRVAFEVKGLE
jgi:hypothetical protein